MKEPKDWIRAVLSGGISRREFVERAAVGGLSVMGTAKVLSAAPQAAGRLAKDYNQTQLTPYEDWVDSEATPVYHGYATAALGALELKPWERMAGRGAFIDLIGGEGVND